MKVAGATQAERFGAGHRERKIDRSGYAAVQLLVTLEMSHRGKVRGDVRLGVCLVGGVVLLQLGDGGLQPHHGRLKGYAGTGFGDRLRDGNEVGEE